MRVCIITLEGAREPKTWSRTPLSIIECMEKHNIEIDNLSYLGKNKHYVWGKIKAAFYKLFYNYGGNFRDPFPFWYRMNANFFEKEMEKFNSDAYIFMGEQCARHKEKLRGKTYVYLDRIIGEMARFDEDMRLGKEWFIKGYEENDRRSLSCMEHIFTLNDWSKNEIINRYGISSNKITNVGVGINLVAYLGEKNYKNHEMMIVLRKGTEHYKGLDLLLDAFIIAKKEIDDLTLHVVGTDYMSVRGVYYYANQPRSVTECLFKKCSLYVMPALLEPNGTTYLEALANKTPTVGLNRFAFPEFCGYGKYGFIVDKPTPTDVAKSIIEAYSDPERLEKMGKEGQDYVLNRFTWENVTKSMLNVIRNDLEGLDE